MKKVAKVAKGKRFDVLKAEKHILIRAGMFVTLMHILYHNRLLEKTLAPLRHDSHVVLRALVIRNATVMKNYGLAVRIALRHHNEDIAPLKDFIGYGVEGLIKAVEGFNLEKGSKFSSYAGMCIAQTIKRSVIENELFIYLPEHRVVEKKRKAREETKAQVKGVEIPQDLQKREKINPEVVFSLDDLREGDDGDTLPSLVSIGTFPSPEDFVLENAKKRRREIAISILEKNLDPDDWFILSKYFGIFDDEPQTESAIGLKISKSRQRVNLMRHRAIGRAGRALRRNKILASNVL